MRYLDRLSIKNKLIIVVLLVTIMTLTIGFSIVTINDIKNFRKDMVDSTNMSARLIGWSCISALAFEDKKGVQDILTRIELMPSIVNVYVYDETNALFAAFEKKKGEFEKPRVDKQVYCRFDQGYLHTGQPIVYQDRHYGSIHLRATTDVLDVKVKKYMMTMAALLVGLVVVTYILASGLQRLISKPILRLADLSQKVSSKADYSVRITRQSGDEIGLLYDSFNNMLEQIHHREIAREMAEKELKKNRDNLEAQVKIRTAELAVAKETAETANAAKSDFLARMSHEIRTPLNAITGLTQILLKSKLTTEQQDYLNKVQLAGGNLLQVINDILDFSKVEAGQLELTHTPFDLDQLMEQLNDLLYDRVTQKDLELIFALDPNIPRQLKGDSPRLAQVLINLVTNAFKFTEAGEIVVKTEFAVQADPPPGQTVIQFSVGDTGIGIAADVLPTLFDPFTQADSYLTRNHEGTGLGLAICRRLVELMGGSIWAESTPGRGSTFFFTVMLETWKPAEPVLCQPMDLHGLKAHDLSTHLPSLFAGRRVLVVEDSELNREVAVALLEDTGLIVEIAANGKIAVEKVTESPRGYYDTVLMDIQMPVMDGYEATWRIREWELKMDGAVHPPVDDHPPSVRPGRVAIIALTAHALKGEKEKCLDADMDDYLAKPIDEKALHQVLIKWILSQ